MTVRANKPAFNVREKLKSLDYSLVPYEKMPEGSVISTETKMFAETSTNGNSAQTIVNNMEFCPKLPTSRVLMDFNLRNVTGGTDNYTSVQVWWGTSSTYGENTRLDTNSNSGTDDRGKNGILYLSKRGTGAHDIMTQSYMFRDVPVYGTMKHYLTLRLDNSSSSTCVVGRHSTGFSIAIQEIKQ
tara:strand:- start:1429 stop:1983 length:555 start_codon:yes stop_codon:yes gene_type:complete